MKNIIAKVIKYYSAINFVVCFIMGLIAHKQLPDTVRGIEDIALVIWIAMSIFVNFMLYAFGEVIDLLQDIKNNTGNSDNKIASDISAEVLTKKKAEDGMCENINIISDSDGRDTFKTAVNKGKEFKNQINIFTAESQTKESKASRIKYETRKTVVVKSASLPKITEEKRKCTVCGADFIGMGYSEKEFYEGFNCPVCDSFVKI